MSISELANSPIEITLGGKTLKIKRLTISESFIPAETKVQQDYIKNIHRVAETLSGKEKTDFLGTSLKDIPKGAELDRLAMEYMNTSYGVAQMLLIGFNKCQTVTEEELAHLMMNSNENELNFIKSFLGGEVEDEKNDKKKQEMKTLELVTPKGL